MSIFERFKDILHNILLNASGLLSPAQFLSLCDFVEEYKKGYSKNLKL